jgi:tetratricopeptide (TPR) repeat protein
MKHNYSQSSFSRRIALPLALMFAAQMPFAPTAHAQESEDREEVRVLRASELSREQVSDEYRRRAREARHREMDFAKDLLRGGNLQGERSAELMLRLADLYFQEGRDIFYAEMEAHQRDFDACFNNPNCDTATMVADNHRSAEWQDKSIRLYRRILQQFPNFNRADEAVFYLASALQDTGSREDAIEQFQHLVRIYPDSEFVADAYIQIGEYYFDENNAYLALQAYRKAARFRDSDKFGFALYKLAWCYFNVAEYGRAIETMKRVVTVSEAQEEEGLTGIRLGEEAMRDLVRFFADAGDMDGAIEYFTSRGQTQLIRSMLRRLASTYLEQGKFEETIETYRRLISREPNGPDLPEFQDEIIKAYIRMGRKQQAVEEIERLRRDYGPESSWARQNAANAEALTAANEAIERNLRTVAMNFHEEARRLRAGRSAREAYNLARQAYVLYLQDFPDNRYTYDMRYQYGELLYKLEDFEAAYAEFMTVVSIDEAGQHTEHCAESAIHAANELVEADSGSSPARGTTESVELNEAEQKLLVALDQFARIYPDHADTKVSIYRSAYLLYEHNQFRESSERFRTVIRMDPSSSQAEQAAHLILDSLGLVEDWQTLQAVAQDFISQEDLGSRRFKREIAEVYENASFKLVQVNFEQQENWIGAADGFWAFYQQFPESENAARALNNSAVYYGQEGQRERAMATRRVIVDDFEESEFFEDHLALLGYDHEVIADFEESATLYERLFEVNDEHEKAAGAIYTAAKFREAMGDWQGAITNYRAYMEAYPDATEPSSKLMPLDIAILLEANGQWNDASREFYEFYSQRDTEGITPDQLMFARLHYAQALFELNRDDRAIRGYRASLDWYRIQQGSGASFEIANNFAAEMMYRLSLDEFEAYMALDLSGPGRNASRQEEDRVLSEQLNTKKEALAAIEITLADIVATGAAKWSIAALVRLAECYDNMSSTFENSHIPTYLENENQIRFYQSGMQQFARQYLEKGLIEYNRALEKAYEVHLYNEFTARAAQRRSEILPLDFPTMVEQLLEPNATSAARITYDFVADFE